MKKENDHSTGTILGRLRAKIAGKKRTSDDIQDIKPVDQDNQAMIEEFEAVKRSPGHLTGWDFDRAFEFIERYPESEQAKILIGQMYETTGSQLKGLSYASAAKVLEQMPGHAGAESIIKGMYKIEADYIKELRSDVIAYMLKIIPDHPLADELARFLAEKNLTNAYDFVVANPDNVYTERLIKAMFDRDANISVLLFQEKMDHPRVASIFEGIYNITRQEDIDKLTPNAVIFILEVAPDHPKAPAMIEVLVENNYVKAYEFIKNQPDHALAADIKELILQRKPELKTLFTE